MPSRIQERCTAGSSDAVYHLLAASLCPNGSGSCSSATFARTGPNSCSPTWASFRLRGTIRAHGAIAIARFGTPRGDREFNAERLQALPRIAGGRRRRRPDVVHANLPPALDCDWLEDRRQRVLFKIGRAYEREGRESSALAAYSTCTHPEARVRVIRLHERARADGETARALCLTAQETRQPMRRRSGATAAAPAVAAIESQARPARPPGSSRSKHPELRALARSAVGRLRRGIPGERFSGAADAAARANHSIRRKRTHQFAVPGLLCWRAIFAPVSGAFFHDFHHGPADLSSGGFYRRRERQFSDCFAQLESADYLARRFVQTYEQKAGLQSPFVAWGLLKPALLEWALSCFPAAHLRLWFEWICALAKRPNQSRGISRFGAVLAAAAALPADRSEGSRGPNTG